MSEDEENRLKWNEFVEIGNKIHKMVGKQCKIIFAKYALALSDQLIDNRFILSLPMKEQKVFLTLVAILGEYLDGNAEVIQSAVREYFLVQHCSAGLDYSLFNVSFAPKKSGIQTGFTCNVSDGTQTVRYFIKTHQYGPTEDNPKSTRLPDTKELFVYKLLHLIGIGPQPHFIVSSHGTKSTIYIATKDCHLVLLSNLTQETANTSALVQLDLISCILCLRDCTTNTSNCGQVGQKPMIIDFLIEKQSKGYVKQDILDNFFGGTSEFNYAGLMEAAVKTPNAVKKDIMEKSLQEWKLLENIERAESEVIALIKIYGEKMLFENDLQQYVDDLKATVEALVKF